MNTTSRTITQVFFGCGWDCYQTKNYQHAKAKLRESKIKYIYTCICTYMVCTHVYIYVTMMRNGKMKNQKLNTQHFKKICPEGGLIGIDLGEKYIGIAISDNKRTVASPLKTITKKKFTKNAQEIISIINERSIVGGVIGWPVNMDGTQGKKCQQTNDFTLSFLEIHNIPFLYWDERLTTVEAEKKMIQEDVSRQKRKKYVNHIAAAIILQSALERLKQGE